MPLTTLLLLTLAVPSPAPDPAVERAAVAALDSCLAALEAASPSSTTAPALEQLARAAQRLEACAVTGWTRAAIAERATLALSQAPIQCPPPPVLAPAQACEERPLWLDLLSHAGAFGFGGLGGYGICAIRQR
jgi:hypothetical protein